MRGPAVMRAVAGSGKTYWLVNRYVDLVVDATAPADPQGVVVITFTEAAARELLDRVRERLTRIVADPEADEVADVDPAARAERARHVLVDLASAPIGTIHSFARRLLLRNASTASLSFDAEVAEQLDTGERAVLASRLAADLQARAAAAGLDLHQLRRTSGTYPRTLQVDAGNLIAEVPGAILRAPDWATKDAGDVEQLVERGWRALAGAQAPPAAVLSNAAALDVLDALAQTLGELSAADRQLTLVKDLRASVEHAEPEEPVRKKLHGQRVPGVLTQSQTTQAERLALVAGLAADKRIAAHNDAWSQWELARAAAYARVAGLMAVQTFLSARAQAANERILQDELLQRALWLLRSDSGAAEAMRAAYPVLLLDEAQDIDATQRELLLTLCGVEGLTVVGDPQQSIYGFRGANHRTFDDLTVRLLGEAEPQHQIATRRCAPVVVDAVNAVFAGDGQHTAMQALRAGAHGSVTLLHPMVVERPDPDRPGKSLKPSAADYRGAQGVAIAEEVLRFLAGVSDGRDGVTAYRASDIAILVPSRTPVPAIEAALAARGVPAVVRTSRDLARHPLAEGLVASLIALCDPDDTRALLVALRSPVFALTDSELTEYAAAVGQPRIQVSPTESVSAATAVAECLAILREARRVYIARGPGAALTMLISDRGVLATLAAEGPGWTTGWGQIRLLVDSVTDRWLAAPESDATFVEWLREEVATAASTNRSVLDEPQAAGVTITTVHQAKGLQWPVVLTAALGNDRESLPSLQLGHDDVYTHLDAAHSYQPESPEAAGPPESLRLLYVAMTRAKDHLVLSTLTKGGSRLPDLAQPDAVRDALKRVADDGVAGIEIRDIQVVPSAGASPPDEPRPASDDQAATVARPTPRRTTVDSAADVARTEDRLTAVAAQASKVLRTEAPSSAAEDSPPASASAPATRPRVAESKADDAGAVGDAVHLALERADLKRLVDPEVDSDALWEDVSRVGTEHLTPEDRRRARTIFSHAGTSQVLRRASLGAVLRRELPISGNSRDGNVLVLMQGTIDLLFAEDTPDGRRRWILVDHKTDSSGKSNDEFAARYEPQLRAYAGLLADVGIDVEEAWLVRLTTAGVTDVCVTL